MKKVLIITKDFPPYSPNIGWMIRVAYLSNYIVRNSIETHVVFVKRNKKWEGLFEIDKEVKLHPIKFIYGYWDIPYAQSSCIGKIFKILFRLFCKHKIDPYEKGQKIFLNKSLEILKKYDINNVIVSVPPFSLLQTAISLKKEFGSDLNLIVDFRDAWSIGARFVKNKDKRLPYFCKIEEMIFQQTDHQVFVSNGMERLYNKKFKISDSTVIENGFVCSPKRKPEKNFHNDVNIERKKGKFILGYFGSGSANGTMSHKDLSALFNVFRDNEELASKISFFIQGRVALPRSLPKSLSIHIYVAESVDVAQANMSLMDVCLFVYSEEKDAPLAMGGKIYDYMYSGTPIWLIIPNNADSLLELASKTKKMFVSFIEDKKTVVNSLENLLRLSSKKQLKVFGFSYEEIKIYSRDYQYAKFIKLLK